MLTKSKQSIARGLFQLSRRDREFLLFSLMLRDEIENFFLSVSCFETRSRSSSFQSHASRRDWEFLSLNLVLRDENENFFYQSQTSRQEREFFFSNLVFREGDENLKIISQGRARKNEPNSHENSRDREFSLCSAVKIVNLFTIGCYWTLQSLASIISFCLYQKAKAELFSGYLDNYFKEESNCCVETAAGAEKNLLADCN